MRVKLTGKQKPNWYQGTQKSWEDTPAFWSDGIGLINTKTDLSDGTMFGWDADHGELVAYKGKAISVYDLPKKIKIKPQPTIAEVYGVYLGLSKCKVPNLSFKPTKKV